MEKIVTNKKIYLILLVVILIGFIVIGVKGFNVENLYRANNRIEINVGKEFEEEKVKQIAEEILGKNVILQPIEVYKEEIAITNSSISEEQKNNIIEKINSEFGIELNSDDIKIQNISNVRVRDILKKYVKFFVISTIIILVYVGIRYFKLGLIKVLIQTALIAVIAPFFALSLIAIIRIPVGSLTPSILILTQIIAMTIAVCKLEKVNK